MSKNIITFIIFFVLFINTASGVHISGIAANSPFNSFVTQSLHKDNLEVAKYSSFIQISKRNMLDMCLKMYEALQANLVFFSSAGESAIKNYVKACVWDASRYDFLFIRPLSIIFSGSFVYAAVCGAVENCLNMNILFIFLMLQLIMLLLYALYKGNIPDADVSYSYIKFSKARYQ